MYRFHRPSVMSILVRMIVVVRSCVSLMNNSFNTLEMFGCCEVRFLKNIIFFRKE